MARPAPHAPGDYPHRRVLTTRWRDLDPYGHMNNAVQGELFDTAEKAWLIEQGARDIQESAVVGPGGEPGSNKLATRNYREPGRAGLRLVQVARTRGLER